MNSQRITDMSYKEVIDLQTGQRLGEDIIFIKG